MWTQIKINKYSALNEINSKTISFKNEQININCEINKYGYLIDENGNILNFNGEIDLYGKSKNYKLTFQNGLVTLIEDLDDEAYWEQKIQDEHIKTIKCLNCWQRILYIIKIKYYSIKFAFILKFRTKSLFKKLIISMPPELIYNELDKQESIINRLKDIIKDEER